MKTTTKWALVHPGMVYEVITRKSVRRVVLPNGEVLTNEQSTD